MTSIVFAQSEEYTEWKRVDENSYIDSDGIVGAEDIYGFTFYLNPTIKVNMNRLMVNLFFIH